MGWNPLKTVTDFYDGTIGEVISLVSGDNQRLDPEDRDTIGTPEEEARKKRRKKDKASAEGVKEARDERVAKTKTKGRNVSLLTGPSARPSLVPR